MENTKRLSLFSLILITDTWDSIGTVHLVLSSLPQKILRVVSAFGWKADKHLGFALLKLCLEERRIRSPMASLMLLAYYTVLTSLCPQILANEYTQPAIEVNET